MLFRGTIMCIVESQLATVPPLPEHLADVFTRTAEIDPLRLAPLRIESANKKYAATN